MFRRQMIALTLAVPSIPFFAIASGSPQAQLAKTDAQAGHTPKTHTPKAQRVFQMWIYNMDHGKLDTANKHFSQHACRLYRKHGIELIGFWTRRCDIGFLNQDEAHAADVALNYALSHPANQAQSQPANQAQSQPANQAQKHPTNQDQTHRMSDCLVALLAFPSRDAAAASWKALAADPEWTKESQTSVQGHLFSGFAISDMEPTDYSPMK